MNLEDFFVLYLPQCLEKFYFIACKKKKF